MHARHIGLHGPQVKLQKNGVQDLGSRRRKPLWTGRPRKLTLVQRIGYALQVMGELVHRQQQSTAVVAIVEREKVIFQDFRSKHGARMPQPRTHVSQIVQRLELIVRADCSLHGKQGYCQRQVVCHFGTGKDRIPIEMRQIPLFSRYDFV